MSGSWAAKGRKKATDGVLISVINTAGIAANFNIDADLKKSYNALAWTFINEERKDMLNSRYSSSTDRYVHKKYMYKLLKYFHNQIRNSAALHGCCKQRLNLIDIQGANLVKNCKYLLALESSDHYYLSMYYGVKE